MSRQVRNRSENAAYVVSSLAEHRADVVAGLLEHNEGLAAEKQINEDSVRAFLQWLSDVLEHKTETLKAVELAYVEEQADDPAVRQRRDEAVPVLLSRLTQTRARVATVFGDTGQAAYGLTEPAPRTPAELADYAGVVLTLLRANPRAEDDGIGGTLDTAVLADVIEEAWIPLRAALDDLRREQRQLEGMLVQRNRVMDTWSEFYQGTATAYSVLYRLAGLEELARRVKPTVRRTDGKDPAPEPDEPALPPVPEVPDGAVAEGSAPVAVPGSPASAARDSVPAGAGVALESQPSIPLPRPTELS